MLVLMKEGDTDVQVFIDVQEIRCFAKKVPTDLTAVVRYCWEY